MRVFPFVPVVLTLAAIFYVGFTPAASAQKPGSAPAGQTQGASAGNLNALLDEVITQDSTSWLLWRYDRGSARNARMENTSGTGVRTLYGEYTFNGGRGGWVRVQFTNDQVQCIQFWNEGRCRPFRSPPSHGVLKGLVAGAAAGAASGSSGSGSGSTGQNCRYEAMPGVPGSRQRICD